MVNDSKMLKDARVWIEEMSNGTHEMPLLNIDGIHLLQALGEYSKRIVADFQHMPIEVLYVAYRAGREKGFREGKMAMLLTAKPTWWHRIRAFVRRWTPC